MQKEEEEDVERHTNVGEVVYKLAFVPAAHTSQTLVSVQQPTQSDPWRSFLVRRVTRFLDQKCQFGFFFQAERRRPKADWAKRFCYFDLTIFLVNFFLN